MNGKFNKWDDTICETTKGWTSSEAQSGLVLIPGNTRDSTDKITTEHRQNIWTENR